MVITRENRIALRILVISQTMYKKVKETAEAAKAEADKKPEVLETPEAPDAELLAEIFPAEPASDAEYQTKW